MRKRTILALVAILVIASIVKASPVDPRQAIQVAQRFVPKSTAQRAPIRGSRTEPSSSIVYTHMMPNSDRPAFYIVNVDDGAFVLVSADDVAHQVLGYSFSSTWPVTKDGSVELPEHIRGFFDDLAAQMESAVEAEPARAAGSYKASPRSASPNRSPSLPDSVGPLLTTTWNQGQYYNALCPEDDNGPDGHVYTGCVATAMAQIIKYWSDSTPGRGTHSYSTNYGTLTVNYSEASYDYSSMPNELDENSTQAQINAVAQLIYHCGVATNMQYGAYQSSSFDRDARAGLINFYHFSPNLSYAEKAFFTDTDWNDLMHQEIAANRPVLYSGFGDSGGHTFVCDGYKADNYYHFNFGWGGFCDGWYLTSAVNPNDLNYNSTQTAIVGIVPDSSGIVILGQTTGNSTFTVDEPLEFYNLMGHNAYEGSYYNNLCDNTVTFMPFDNSKQMVADILEFEDQRLRIYNGSDTNNLLSDLIGGNENNLSPVVSTSNALTINYTGNMYHAGFRLHLSQEGNNRIVSNILTSVDNSIIHFAWTENGTATQWQIEYGEVGFAQGDGTLLTVEEKRIDIEFPQKLTEYDVYIRSICGNDVYSPWVKKTVRTEAPYWQDIINSRPESFHIDENNCVLITCAEDFVWYIKCYNSANAAFVNDVDMDGYKWKPFELQGNIQGNGHTIKNLYISEVNSFTGLFSHCVGMIENLGIDSSYISGTNGVAAMCGEINGLASVVNCYVTNTEISGTDIVGGISGYNFGLIKNSYVNINVSGNRWTGLLTGDSRGSILNCYAAGSIKLRSFCYYAGIAAYAATGIIDKCYSIDLPMGVIGYEGMTHISDTSSFYNNNTQWTLRTPVSFEESTETDLLSALNASVLQMNDSTLRVWVEDTDNTNGGLPELGKLFIVQYPNVANLTVQNSKINGESCVILNWEEKGSAERWEIRYNPTNEPLDSAKTVVVNSMPYILYDVPLARECTFSVRSIYNNEHSGWNNIKEMVDLPFWTDIVTEQPEGFVEDNEGNVIISSAEGLAWLAAVVNGLNGNEGKTFKGKTVSLTNDIDLQGYRWNPIGRGWYAKPDYNSSFEGTFEGNLHSITNMYVNCPYVYLGLFGYASNEAYFKNVSIKNGYVNSYFCDIDGGGYGGLLGSGWEIKGIINCSSDAAVKGIMEVGSLCGYLFDQEGESAIISNCYATGDVYGRESTAGLIGEARGVVIQNSYATGNVYLYNSGWNPWYRGGLVGNLMSNASVRNCYSTGTVEINDQSSYYGRVIGCTYSNSSTHYVYGPIDNAMKLAFPSIDEIADTASFDYDNASLLLTMPIIIGDSAYDNLLDVLNAWVANINDKTLKAWVSDTSNVNGGYPVFGDYYEPTCFNPTNVRISNTTIVGDTIIRTKIEWEQEGNPSSWEILYVDVQQNITQGTIITVKTNPCELTNLPVGRMLDIYVRAKNDEQDISGWSKMVRYVPDKLHWTDVVTIKPDGYFDDGNGNVFISSPEGLAWLSSVFNELNGNQYDHSIKHIYLTNDIDLSEYRWTAIKTQSNLLFEGNGHTITGLYCNEYANRQGLFSYANCTIQNVYFTESSIHGLLQNGIIAGVFYGTIKNCIVRGCVSGVQYLGGMCGEIYGDITNSSFIGTVNVRFDISLPNSVNGYSGGIYGSGGSKVINTYLVAETTESTYSGIITGAGNSSELISNSYYKSYQTSLPLTSDNTNISNISSFSGSDITWTLYTPPYINGDFHADLIDALNEWVDVNNINEFYRHWVIDTLNVNGGYPIFAPLPKCIISFKNADGDTLQIDTLEYGSRPVYRGAIPALESTAEFAYTFREWSVPLDPVTHDITFTALYDVKKFGDVTDNWIVDIQDATIVVNYILGERSDNYLYHMADMNNDTEIDVFDLTAIINVILGRTSFQAPMRTGSSGYETTAYLFGNESTNIVGEEDIYLRHVSDKIGLSIANASRFTSFQMDVEVPDGAELQNVELTGCERTHIVQKAKIGDNMYRVIALSMSSQPFADINDELVSFQITKAANAEISVSNVMFVTPKGEAHYFNGASTMTPTIINEITTDNDEVIFDLSGRRIYKKPNELERGVYIIDKKKVVIK